MRCVLRFKESGQGNARVVIIADQNLRIGGEVRAEAPVFSWRGRSLNPTNVTHNRRNLRKGGVQTAFLQGQCTGHDVERLAEPVAEVGGPLHMSENQVVVLTRFCCGLIDAPRRWWLTLQHGLTKQGWRHCTMGITLHQETRLAEFLGCHVDHLVLAGDETDH